MRDARLFQRLFGRVFHHRHFLQDHVPLYDEVLLVKARREQHAEEQLQQFQRVLRWHQAVQTGELAAGVCVDLPTHGLKAPRQGQRITLHTALEYQMLQQMGIARLRRGLVTTTIDQPHPQRRTTGMGLYLPEDSHPIGKVGYLNRIWARHA